MKTQERQALVTALRMLAATPKSRKNLQQKLEQKGFDRNVLESTLARLERQGLLNDRTFALSLYQSLSSYRPSGRKRIAYELEKRGIEETHIQEILEKYSPEEERNKAIELAWQKHERWKNLEPVKRKKKIYDFLVRRGFDFSLSRDVVREVERNP